MLISINLHKRRNCPQIGRPIQIENCKTCTYFSHSYEYFGTAHVWAYICTREKLSKEHSNLDISIARMELAAALAKLNDVLETDKL